MAAYSYLMSAFSLSTRFYRICDGIINAKMGNIFLY